MPALPSREVPVCDDVGRRSIRYREAVMTTKSRTQPLPDARSIARCTVTGWCAAYSSCRLRKRWKTSGDGAAKAVGRRVQESSGPIFEKPIAWLHTDSETFRVPISVRKV